MDNTTALQPVPVTQGQTLSSVFPGLSTAEEVIVWAAIAVGILGVFAIALRLMMPMVRKRTSKKEMTKAVQDNSSIGTVSVVGSTGKLLGGFSASSPSLISTDMYESADSLKREKKPIPASSFYQNVDTSISMEALPRVAVSSPAGSVKSLPVSTSTATSRLMVHGQQSRGSVIASQYELNEELSSVLSTPTLQRLQSLNLSDVYTENWNRHQRPAQSQPSRPLPEGNIRF